MHIDIQHAISHYGYIGVFFILMMEMIGIPFPAETTLTISGFEWMSGVFSLFPLLLSAALGNIVGSTIAYGIGFYLGRPVILRLGRYVGITAQKLEHAEARFLKYRTPIVIFSKFIAGIRVLVPYLAGINRMPFFLFTIYNAVSAFLWAAFFIIVGKYVEVGWSKYHAVLHKYLVPIGIVLVLIVACVVALKMKRKRQSRTGS